MWDGERLTFLMADILSFRNNTGASSNDRSSGNFVSWCCAWHNSLNSLQYLLVISYTSVQQIRTIYRAEVGALHSFHMMLFCVWKYTVKQYMWYMEYVCECSCSCIQPRHRIRISLFCRYKELMLKIFFLIYLIYLCWQLVISFIFIIHIPEFH